MPTYALGALSTTEEALTLLLLHGCRVRWDEVTSSCFYCEESGSEQYEEGPLAHHDSCVFKRAWELQYNMDCPEVKATFEAL